MVEAIGIGDERIHQGTQIEQVIPITVVARHARDVDGYDDADVAQSHLGHQPIEADPCNAAAAATHAKVFIDDRHL
jgi:hypothetical protein